VFLTGTSTEVLPVIAIDGRKIADGQPGPMTLNLRRELEKRANQNDV
jgi:branched-subunit amino acid aminotransferase/4-amino-4-deoxychorismate lyase